MKVLSDRYTAGVVLFDVVKTSWLRQGFEADFTKVGRPLSLV